MTVDVVIPCYNYARYLEYCVDSVLGQRGVQTRVLIIDDCSTDQTESLGRELAARHEHVEYRRHGTNRGHIDTYNEGVIEWARNEYLLLISADDGLLPGGLALAVDALEAHPQASFCHGAAVRGEHPPSPADRGPEARVNVRTLSGAEFWRETYAVGFNPIEAPTVVVRTTCQQAAGGYRKDLPHSGDLHMWLILAAVGDVCEVLAPLAFKRVHGHNMSVGYYATPLEDPLQLLAAFDEAWQHAGSLDLAASGLLNDARRQIAERVFWEGSKALETNDVAHADRCLELACRAYPALVQSPAFRRFTWKRRLGPIARPIARLAERWRRRHGH